MIGTYSLIQQAAVLLVVLVAIWMIVDRFIVNATARFIVQVVGGAILIVLAIRVLASLVGI